MRYIASGILVFADVFNLIWISSYLIFLDWEFCRKTFLLFHGCNFFTAFYVWIASDVVFARVTVTVTTLGWIYLTRDDWNDRWKRRKRQLKKLSMKIKDMGGRLVPVPT